MRQVVHRVLVVNSVQLVELLEALLVLAVEDLAVLAERRVRNPPTLLHHVGGQIVGR